MQSIDDKSFVFDDLDQLQDKSASPIIFYKLLSAYLTANEPENALKAFDILVGKPFVKDMDKDEKAQFLQIVESFIKNAKAKGVDLANFADLYTRSGDKDDITSIKAALIWFKIGRGDLQTAFKMAFTSPTSEDRYLLLDDIIDRAIQKAVNGDDTTLKLLIDKEHLMAFRDIRPRGLANIANLYLKKAEAGDKTDSQIVSEALQRLPEGDTKTALLARYDALIPRS